ncbi:MAG: hypothetical protein JJT78_18460 [Leptospira sp.]|nr:hypothetical protein [Leptospira sp.]
MNAAIPTIQISRKELLKSSLLLGVSFSLLKCFPASNHKKFLILSPSNIRTLEKFMEAILPDTDSMPNAQQASVARRLDEELYFVDESISADFCDALMFVEWYPLFSDIPTSWKKFSNLSLAERKLIIQETCQNKSGIVRSAFSNIRMIGYLMYYGNPTTWSGIGYDGPFGGFPEKDSEQRAHYREVIQ